MKKQSGPRRKGRSHKENHLNKSFIKEVDKRMFILTYCQLIMYFAEQVILYLLLRPFGFPVDFVVTECVEDDYVILQP